MKTPAFIKIIFLAAAALPLFAVGAPTNVVPQVQTVASVGQPTEPPPKNQKDVIPAAPGSRTLWYFIDGHWEWRGQYVWVPGHWRSRPHPGDIWLPGKWVEQNNQTNTVYVWHGGKWRSGAHDDEESTDK